MRLLALVTIWAALAAGQVSVYGTSGAVQSANWAQPTLHFGGGASYTHKRLTVGGEAWRAEVDRQRSWQRDADQRAEAIQALAAWRVWRSVHAEGGAGVQRITAASTGLFWGTAVDRQQRAFASAGAYYQTPGRVFVRVGYRRLFVRSDHDTNQIYTSVGVTF